jgi:hypothetical protein
MPKGSVKIMLSYDYCHFEIALATDNEEMTLEQIDEMRKDAQRLADKAVEQYRIAKNVQTNRMHWKDEVDRLENQVNYIVEKYPESEWTEEQKAKIKIFNEYSYKLKNSIYDYQDDWKED